MISQCLVAYLLRKQDDKNLLLARAEGGVRSEARSTAGHLLWWDKFVCSRRHLTAGSYFKLHFIYLFNRLADCSTDSPLVLFFYIMSFLNYIIKPLTISVSFLSDGDFTINGSFGYKCYHCKWERIKHIFFVFHWGWENDKLKMTCLRNTSINNIVRPPEFKACSDSAILIHLFSLYKHIFHLESGDYQSRGLYDSLKLWKS